MGEEIDYKKLYEQEQKKVSVLERRLAAYEENGPAKLYYSLNRKSWEMADMLNAKNIKDIPLEDPKDKTFERFRFIINDSTGIATAVEALGKTAGITNDEEKDIKTNRSRITPESMAEAIGDNKLSDV